MQKLHVTKHCILRINAMIKVFNYYQKNARHPYTN